MRGLMRRQNWYRYTIYNHKHASALNRRMVAHVPYALDPLKMQRALCTLLGRHDFAALRFGKRGKGYDKGNLLCAAAKCGDLLVLDIVGSGFLYNMVRIIAGTLIDIGRGKLQTDAFAKMLRTKERIQGGITAPPQGLVLQRVYYGAPPSYEQYLCEKSLLDGVFPA